MAKKLGDIRWSILEPVQHSAAGHSADQWRLLANGRVIIAAEHTPSPGSTSAEQAR